MIPFDVYLTWQTLNLPPRMKQNYLDLCKQNPEFTFHLYDDVGCRDFIVKFFSKEIVDAYDGLKPGAYKADLWRLCILYEFGGIYMDIKLKCVDFKLTALIDKEHFARDRPSHSLHIYNSIMVCKPKNIFLLASINQIVENVKHKYYGESQLSPTGPEMLGRVASNFAINLDMKHVDNTYVMYENNLILKNYDEYREEQRNTIGYHYIDLWLSRNVYE